MEARGSKGGARALRVSEGQAPGDSPFVLSAPSLFVSTILIVPEETVARASVPLDFQELDCGQLPREERLAHSPLPFLLSPQLPAVTTSGVLLGLASRQVPTFSPPF